MFQSTSATSPCGIGGSQTQSGPCTGTYGPSDVGSHVFDGISASHVVGGLLAAGAIVAAVIFAVFLARKVGRFFNGPEAQRKRRHADFWREVGDAENRASARERAGRSDSKELTVG